MHAEPVVFDRLPLIDIRSGPDPTQYMRFACPISEGSGAQGVTVAYTVLDPGGSVPWHFESVDEEVLLVLEGQVEVTSQLPLDNAVVAIESGGAMCIQARKPHMVRNTGPSIAKLVHLFGHPRVTATFADPLLPLASSVLHYSQFFARKGDRMS